MRADAEGQTALRLRQGAQRAEKLDRAVPGRFVTGMERQEAQREAKVCGVLASFDGGWDDAERVQVCFHPDGVDAEFTAVWLEISWAAKFARVGHSDLLGSLMALGMDRSLFGDLMVEDGTAYLLAMPEAAKSLQDEWHEAGHTAIRVRLLDAPPQFTPPQGAQMRDTVASLRLDCVLAAGMSLSRGARGGNHPARPCAAESHAGRARRYPAGSGRSALHPRVWAHSADGNRRSDAQR